MFSEVLFPLIPHIHEVAASGAAVHLGATIPHSARGYAIQAVSAPAYVGDSTVTASTGFELLPGDSPFLIGSSSLQGWYIADGSTVRVMRFEGGV